MSIYSIRRMRHEMADYQRMADVERLMFPDDYGTSEAWREQYEGDDPAYLNESYFVEEAGQAVAAFQFHETPAMHLPGKVRLWLMVPQGASEALCETLVSALEARMADHPINRAVGPVNEAYPALMTALQAHGFRSVLQQVATTLNVAAFDPAPYAATAQRLAEAGIRVVALDRLMAEDDGWAEKLYELHRVARRDIPRKPGIRATDVTLDQWRNDTFGSDFRAPLWMVAVTETGDYIGTGNLWLWAAVGTIADNGFLGVLRPYRRRGVARALKVALIEAAQKAGIAVINTSNEMNNPMLQLNQQLGFVETPHSRWHQMEKWYGL
ncbi:MAG: GNAT family N-acetyltransferase [Anaerolineales bacterium]|nr:GNAT family N-acetyltransferase [Anaerolineales bacterium]